MVLRLGSSLRNHSLTQLVKDFRNVMQPHTAINLRERKANKLKDFIVMAGPLGVSDLFIFNQKESSGNVSLRIGKMPRGPTLLFRVNSYSLAKDVRRILKHPKSVGKDSAEMLAPPLLVLNGFQVDSDKNHEKLLVTVLQNMFPPIQPQLTKVSEIKRVLMITKNPENDEIEWRHYAINTKLVEGNRNVKKLINSHHNLKKSLPNLSRTNDVSELLLDPYAVGGVTSDSEVEDDAIVEIKNETPLSKKEEKKPVDGEDGENANGTPTRKRAIKLTEIGPRLNLSLLKIEENLTGSSKTLYHAKVTKTSKEEKELARKHAAAQKLKAERRAKQKANVDAKNRKKDERKARRKAAKNGEEGAEGAESDNSDVEMSLSDEDAPDIKPEDYENDSDLYSDIEE